MGKNLPLLLLFTLFLAAGKIVAQQTASVGNIVYGQQLVDPNDNPKAIPFLHEKVLAVFYTDPDQKDVNDPLSDAIKAKNFPKDKYAGIGIANCKDTWIPDAAIRMKARQKEKQFPGSIILLDTKRILSKAWGLGDCNGLGVVIIIGKDAKIRFIKNVKTQEESKAIIPQVLQIIEEEISK
ncbi:MAG TPA: YtfJ family protein [Bacteroidales bacterium]